MFTFNRLRNYWADGIVDSSSPGEGHSVVVIPKNRILRGADEAASNQLVSNTKETSVYKNYDSSIF